MEYSETTLWFAVVIFMAAITGTFCYCLWQGQKAHNQVLAASHHLRLRNENIAAAHREWQMNQESH